MIDKLKIYITDSTDPYTNLAMEKVLFDSVQDDEMILYLWQNQNTVVIGKNQNLWAECSYSLLKSEGAVAARRLSGGGAVFHDTGNLNFTFISTTNNYDLTRNMAVIQKACLMAGIETELSGRNDILANGKKFSGNAFYNSKGKSYHHGTIMINTDKEKLSRYLTPSKAKLKAKGVKSVKSRVANLSEFNPGLDAEAMKSYMISAAEDIFGAPAGVAHVSITQEITNLANLYKSDEFLFGYQPPFTFECEKRFEWGNIDLKVNVVKGIIKETKVYTDSMDYSLSEKIQAALEGCSFETDKIKDALTSVTAPDIAQSIAKLIKEGDVN